MKYQPIIGLEVHVELKTKSKMFCSCSADYFGKPPNTHVCPICLGLPGTLPVPNRKAIEWCLMSGLALNCQIPKFSKFDRKNYFYPDLPKGYQISQYDMPFAVNGKLKLKTRAAGKASGDARQNSKLKNIRIRRVHMEEDTAKLIHLRPDRGQGKYTMIDFNRSGVPLMEIVSEPDIRSPSEAKTYLKKLQQTIRYLGVSDCDMEKGSMRCEANISLKRKTNKLSDYKVEIKNLNSFRFVEKALEYEIERQKRVLSGGRKLTQETRGWDEVKQLTFPQRVKETAADYRYFPEPDIPPIRWRDKEIKQLRMLLPELPDEKEKRYEKEYGLSLYQVGILIQTRERADYFEEAVTKGKKYQIAATEIANVIINKRVNLEKLQPLELVKILVKKKIKSKIRVKDLKKVIKKVLGENPQAVEDYKRGKEEVIQFLIGCVMKATKGKADPKQTRKQMLKFLKS